MNRHHPSYPTADLTTCDLEPIHVPGAIQPHGALVALDAAGIVTTASANCLELLGVEPRELIGSGLDRALGTEATRAVSDHLWTDVSEPLRLVLDVDLGTLAGTLVDVMMHETPGGLLVEIEPMGGTASTAGPVSYRAVHAADKRLEHTDSVAELCDQLVREIRTLTGFDRVMVYRFDDMWNGEVVAEDKRADLNSFLGLHYPASDIPVQARRLYTISRTRLIADVGYSPVPLVPTRDAATGEPLDLSHSVLRSVSPIHLEYLSHMGVTASMSVSLVSDGTLTALVACHHYSGPHRPSQDARSASELLARTASQVLDERERSQARADAAAAEAVLAELMARVSLDARSPLDTLVADPRILALVAAGGVAVWSGETLTTAGDVPPASVLRQIADQLDLGGGTPISDRHLGGVDARLSPFADVAAGALRIGIGPDRWVLWVRPALEQVVDWGGDPTNKLLAATEGPQVRLSPRRSFAKWRQVVSGHSEPWTAQQGDVADSLRHQVSALMLLRSREQIAIAESLQRIVVLNETPVFEGLEVVGRYRPADGSQLGGDWWDAFALDDGRIAFVVGDVAGHGVSAATTMTQLRTAVRAYMAEGHTASTCVDRLDQLMSTMLDGRTATITIATVDPRSRVVELTNAGHPVPLLVDRHGARPVDMPVRPLLGSGVGIATSVAFVASAGDVLLLYSDGLVERRDTAIDVTATQLGTHAAHRPDTMTLGAWADDLLTAVPRAGRDDTTLVAIRFPL